MDSKLKVLSGLCKQLKLSQRLVTNCEGSDEQYIDFVIAILAEEIKERRCSRISAKVKAARFPAYKPLTSYEYGRMQFPQTIDREAMEALTFIKKKENLIFYGPVGTGKTHLAIALGLRACEENYTVRFYTLIELAIKLNEYYAKGKLERFINDLKKVDLLILDEWGYLPVDLQASRLLFRVIADVYERHSLIITTNIDFSKWSGIFSDTQMAMAMVDRLVHHGHLFRFDGESYRLMHALMTQ